MRVESASSPEKPDKKKLPYYEQVSFARPPFAEEWFTEDNKKLFDRLPGHFRHFIKRLVDHGDFLRASKEASLSEDMGLPVTLKDKKQGQVGEHLEQAGLDVDTILAHLKDCLEAKSLKLDAKGRPFETVDMNVKLRTLELLLKIKGEFQEGSVKKKQRSGITDLFPELKEEK